MEPASSSSARKIRPHRKSRAGCSSCKLRKVKCNEEKPCSNCITFGLPCSLISDSAHLQHAKPLLARRGRGRPRKAWTAGSPSRASSPGKPPIDADPVPINADHAELLLHFVSTTAETFGGSERRDMLNFWTRSVPHIGLSHPFVLHFVLALAAFHMAYLATREIRRDDEDALPNSNPMRPRRSRSDYLTIAQEHLTAGVSGFSSQLSQPSSDNCGALYLGAVLTSYCTFADGPTSRDDLLVCTGNPKGNGAGDSEDVQISGSIGDGPAAAESSCSSGLSMPFVSGVRLLHQSFSPDMLSAGLMKPLFQGPPPLLEGPIYARDGFQRLDWEEALDGLKDFIVGIASESKDEGDGRTATHTRTARQLEGYPVKTAEALLLKALDTLIGIYAAIYGRRGPDGEIIWDSPPENQFVFGWLYRVEPGFAGCVRTCDPCALLVLAHFAVLLNEETIQGGWYMRGWREHIIVRVGELLWNGRYREWMRWPREQIALKDKRSAS